MKKPMKEPICRCKMHDKTSFYNRSALQNFVLQTVRCIPQTMLQMVFFYVFIKLYCCEYIQVEAFFTIECPHVRFHIRQVHVPVKF